MSLIPLLRWLWCGGVFAVAACSYPYPRDIGSDGPGGIPGDVLGPSDALAGPSDALAGPSDAMPMNNVSLDCESYCTEVQTNCTAANAQYPDMPHCLGTCKAFVVGTLADRSGATLGCRLYYGGTPASTPGAMGADLHCPHAGPGGDQITAAPQAFCSGGNVCFDFCAIEVKTCGTFAAPLTGVTPQYQDMAACVVACGNFPNNTQNYSIGAKGDSLACRLYHVTNAAAQVNTTIINTHCGHSGPAGGSICTGAP